MRIATGSDNRIAIVGASSLRGKEIKQVLEDRNFPATDIALLDDSVMAGTLTEAAGEATFIRVLEEDSFEGIRFVFFAGTVTDAENNWLAAERAGATVIDLTGAVTASGRATTWIPSLTAALAPRPGKRQNGATIPYFSPAAPVIVACTLAAGLAKFQPRRIVLMLFPPVSERDRPGIEELESQTTNLLAFRPIEQSIFDAQVAFNLLSAYGEGSQLGLREVRSRIVREVSDFLDGRAPMPSIQMVQAPVFYGYAFAAYAEFDLLPALDQMETTFENLGVKVGKPSDPPPTNVSIAGESEIQLAPIEADSSSPTGVWFWGGADNLRLGATNAVRIAEELISVLS